MRRISFAPAAAGRVSRVRLQPLASSTPLASSRLLSPAGSRTFLSSPHSALSTSHSPLVRSFSAEAAPAPTEHSPAPEKLKHHLHEYSNDMLLIMSAGGDQDAVTEILQREIMFIDGASYEEAAARVEELRSSCMAGSTLYAVPGMLGIGTATITGLLSFPLCFHLGTALWFNDIMVTTEVPQSSELDTVLEVGAWTWNWMEPPLGQLSFFLLTLQFARANMENLGIKPYTQKVLDSRADRLVAEYPAYNAKFVKDFAAGEPLVSFTGRDYNK